MKSNSQSKGADTMKTTATTYNITAIDSKKPITKQESSPATSCS
jgi:hypothetical protein